MLQVAQLMLPRSRMMVLLRIYTDKTEDKIVSGTQPAWGEKLE